MASTAFKRSPAGARIRSPLGAFIATVKKLSGGIAVYSDINEEIQIYEFDGSTGQYSEVGSGASVVTDSITAALISLTSTRVVFAGGSDGRTLYVYDIDSSGLSETSSFVISVDSNTRIRGMCRLTDSLFAMHYVTNGGVFSWVRSVTVTSAGTMSFIGDAYQFSETSSARSISALSNRVIGRLYPTIAGPSLPPHYNINAVTFNGVEWQEETGLQVRASGAFLTALATVSDTGLVMCMNDTEEESIILIREEGTFSEVGSQEGVYSDDYFPRGLTALSVNVVTPIFADDVAEEHYVINYDISSGFSELGEVLVISDAAYGTNADIASLDYFPQSSSLAVYGVDPSIGDEAGGTSVVLTGEGFTDTTTVEFDGSEASSIVVLSSTLISCDTPAGTGTVDVSVLDDTDEYILPDAFEYGGTSGLALAVVDPDNGTSAGGTSVLLIGSGFTAGTLTVTFDGNAASSVFVLNDNLATCDTPAGTGTVDVSVFVLSESATLENGYTYT